MKSLVLFMLTCLVLILPCHGQNKPMIPARSKTKHITYQPVKEARTTRLMPNIIIKNHVFTDENRNNIINADENNTISFILVNQGKGIAENVNFKSLLKNPVQGITFTPQVSVGNLDPGDSVEIDIPIKSTLILETGVAEFRFVATEIRGFNSYPLDLTIETRKFEEPNVQVVDAAFSTDEGGKIKLKYPINLKVLVQNTGKGEAKDLRTQLLFLRENCFMLANENQFNLGNLASGEAVELGFSFTASDKYAFDYIPLKIELSEKYRKYARDTLVTVSLNQELPPPREVCIADVDRNIPVDTLKHQNKYALVIGNEDYKSQQSTIAGEPDVIYARRDAEIFSNYLENTIGLPVDNIRLLKDATSAEMRQGIDLITKLTQKTDSAEIIFYYAGHGLPDEEKQVPYLIPVDVTGTNLTSAIKLSDIYNILGNSGAKRITIFLDACFSGGGRNVELLADRSIKVKPKLEVPMENTIVYSASTGEQSALPYTQKHHGIFTYYLLKKLQDSKGSVTYGELANYLQKEVSIQSLKINQKEQDPQVTYGGNNEEKWINKTIK